MYIGLNKVYHKLSFTFKNMVSRKLKIRLPSQNILYYYVYVFVSVYMHLHMSVGSPQRSKRGWDSLKLESQVVGRQAINPSLPQEQQELLPPEQSLQSLVLHFMLLGNDNQPEKNEETATLSPVTLQSHSRFTFVHTAPTHKDRRC